MEHVAIIEGNIKEIEQTIKKDMEKPMEHFEKELITIRAGRASTTLVENIKVDCYGQLMSMREVATLAAPEANLITISPWDKSIIDNIEKAISTSDLGVTPVNDGNIIRIQLPQMSSARREELAKVLSKKTEESKISVRNIRKEYHNLIRETEKKHDISEDFAKRLTNSLQKITDSYIKKIDEMSEKKATDLKF